MHKNGTELSCHRNKNEKMKNLHFTGDIERYENLNDFLHFMELGGKVVFNIQDKTIIIE